MTMNLDNNLGFGNYLKSKEGDVMFLRLPVGSIRKTQVAHSLVLKSMSRSPRAGLHYLVLLLSGTELSAVV